MPRNTASWHNVVTTRDGGRLALVTDRLLEIFETRTDRCVRRSERPICPMGLKFTPDERLLAMGIRSGQISILWNIAPGRIVQKFAGPQDSNSAVSFSPDQKMSRTVRSRVLVRAMNP